MFFYSFNISNTEKEEKMSNKLFIGNLPFKMNDMDLESLFKEYGEVSSAKVIVNKFTGRSRGFGFVEMSSNESAQKAMDSLDGKEIDGRAIKVNFAREKPLNYSN